MIGRCSSFELARPSLAARIAWALAVLLLAWQALVVPAHVHASRVAVSASVAVGTPGDQRPDQPADCPVCREVAHGGVYLSPGSAQVAPPVLPRIEPAVAPTLASYGSRSLHGWRSRAPPVRA